MAELIPAPFAALLRRLVREFERERKVFDLPARRFWRGSPELDTSVRMHGLRAGNPVGPAAGPHGQMAQNILLSWLAGSRILELKTVQLDDRLAIPRPCIDMATVGYNVEWSQELRLFESLREYVAGSMLVDVARAENLLGRDGPSDKDDTLFDLSVGYGLDGIRSSAIRAWLASMRDARLQVEALRREIPDELKRLRELDFRTRLSDQVTLSTFHGCPAGEIEAIARFLLEEQALHVTVKLNPTLLGREAVDGLLHDVLGYHEIRTRQQDFDGDLQWGPALEVVDRLSERARALGRRFRVKLSNTLVIENHRGFFPASERTMYLSGPPLHVLTVQLLARLRQARPGVPVSFSAGVDNRNFADCVSLGLVPVTTCSDLLKPGGYGRLPKYLDNLEERMRACGARTLGDFVWRDQGRGGQAVRELVADPSLRQVLLQGLEADTELEALLGADHAELLGPLVERAALLNTPVVAARVLADARYRAEAHRHEPRKIGSHLRLFDCINCDKCLPACPNDANFVYEAHAESLVYESFKVEAGQAVGFPGGRFEVREHHQIATFQDFCNDCGNCDVFCPEDGGPYVEKPRFFGSLEAWERLRPRDGFFVEQRGGKTHAWGRLRGHEYRLEIDRPADRAVFGDGALSLHLQHRERRVLRASAEPGAPEGHVLDGSAYLAMATAVDGVLDRARANPVNAATT